MRKIRCYTMIETKGILRIGSKKFYEYVNSGMLEAARVGRHWRVSEDAIKDFLRTNLKGQKVEMGVAPPPVAYARACS